MDGEKEDVVLDHAVYYVDVGTFAVFVYMKITCTPSRLPGATSEIMYITSETYITPVTHT